MHEQGQSGKTAPTPSQQSLFSRGVSLSGAGALCSLVFLSLETVLAVRVLDTATYGLCIFLLVITQILVVLSDLGCKTAITQLVASATAERKAELVQSALVLRIAVVAGFSLLVWLVTPFFLQFESLHFMAPYANSLPLLYAVMSFEGFFGGALFGFQLYQHVVAAQILRGLLRFVFSAIFLLIFALDDFALIYSWLLSFGVAAIYQ